MGSQKAFKNIMGLLSAGQFQGEWSEALTECRKFAEAMHKQVSDQIKTIMNAKLGEQDGENTRKESGNSAEANA